jgi:integrase
MIKRLLRARPEPGYTWCFDIRVAGRRIRESGFDSKHAAQDAVSAIRADYRRLRYLFPADRAGVTIKRVTDEWIAHLKANDRHPKRIRMAEHAFEWLAKVIPSSSPVTRLTTEQYNNFIILRSKGGAGRATIWNDLAVVMGALRHAVGHLRELEGWSPPARPEELARPRSERSRVISQEEERRLGEALRAEWPDVADLFQVALGTAARAGEVLGLKWSDVNWDASAGYPFGWLTVRATKTGERSTGATDDRIVPMNETTAGLLRNRKLIPAELISGVFPDPVNYTWALKTACRSLGIPYGRKTAGGMVFHDTRHSAITRMLQAGADVKTVMDLAGHRRASTTMGYTHSSAESRFKAINALGK